MWRHGWEIEAQPEATSGGGGLKDGPITAPCADTLTALINDLSCFGSRRAEGQKPEKGRGRGREKSETEGRKSPKIDDPSETSLRVALSSVSRRIRLPWFVYHCIHFGGCYCGNIKTASTASTYCTVFVDWSGLEAGHPYLLCQCWRFVPVAETFFPWTSQQLLILSRSLLR